jgi:tyrosinase
MAVRLDYAGHSNITASLRAASPAAPPDRVYLKLENVRGLTNGFVTVYINLPPNEPPAAHPELRAGSVGLFGPSQRQSSRREHGGQGLNFVLEITKVVDRLFVNQSLGQSLQVTVVPHHPVSESAHITIGQISLYRQGS